MNKKNLVLGGILVFLIIFAYIYQGPFQEWKKNAGKVKNFLAQVVLDEIDTVEITKDGETTVLEKSFSRWKVGGTKDFYTPDNLTDSLNFALENISQKDLELVGDNIDRKASFNTDDSGVRVKISQKDKIFEFVVGKITMDFSGNFISKVDDNKTYEIGVKLGFLSQEDWRDKEMFSFMKERVNKIRFQYPDRQFFVEKTENEWKGVLPHSFSVNEEKIDEILDIIASMSATKIPAQSFEGTGLEKNLIIVQVVGEEVDATIMVGEVNDEELYFAKKGDSDNIYLITKEERDILDKKIKDLK